MPISHIKDNNNFWTVVLNGRPYQFDPTHAEYENLIECVKVGDAESFLEVFDVGTVIENWSEGDFSFRDGYLYFDGVEQIATQPTERIIEMIKNGWDHNPMLKYLSNLYENVSQRAVQESYEWSMHKGLPITDDGYMVGYKGVKAYDGEDGFDKLARKLVSGDLVDIYTGKSFRNNIGDVNHMSRRQVCDDHTMGCESGLHIGTFEYAEGWAGNMGTVVLVKFSPADIVSVPSDSSHQKIRVSRYEVIDIARGVIESPVHVCCEEEGDGDDPDDAEFFDDDWDYFDDDELEHDNW